VLGVMKTRAQLLKIGYGLEEVVRVLAALLPLLRHSVERCAARRRNGRLRSYPKLRAALSRLAGGRRKRSVK
jgi:hypothetical protein